MLVYFLFSMLAKIFLWSFYLLVLPPKPTKANIFQNNGKLSKGEMIGFWIIYHYILRTNSAACQIQSPQYF